MKGKKAVLITARGGDGYGVGESREAYRGRLREGAESYAKALANDILR